MTKLIIFDLDGTLLDTREDIANACNYALRMCGCPERRLDEYNMLVGRGIYNLFRGALPPEKRNEPETENSPARFDCSIGGRSWRRNAFGWCPGYSLL